MLIAVAAAAALAMLGGDATCVQAQSGGPGGSCRSGCLQQYNQCRMNSKGAPICDTQYQSCLQGCIPGR